MNDFKLVSTAQMRASDAWTIENLTSSKELMRRAGTGIYEVVDNPKTWPRGGAAACWEVKEGAFKGTGEVAGEVAGESLWKEPVAIVCGKGNNAGDGFVVAELLSRAGKVCELILLSDKFSEDGKYFFDKAVVAGVPYRTFDESMDFSRYGVILDCIFGTGFKGEVRGVAREAIKKINASGAYVVSADINSGLDGDSGLAELAVCSDLTVSIGNFKFGHFRGDADMFMKKKVNIDIGIKIIEV